MAAPFLDEVFTFTQPDGSTIELRGTGNQFEARFTTLDGLPVVQDPATGYFHVAVAAPDGLDRRPSEIRADVNFAEMPSHILESIAVPLPPAYSALDRGGARWNERLTERRTTSQILESLPGLGAAPPDHDVVGAIMGLTVLVDFSDFPGTIDAAEVERFCNLQGYAGFGNNGSVRDYFFDVSAGRLTYTNRVLPYYRALHPRTYYTDPSVPYPQRARELIREVIEHHRAQGVDFSGLSTDGQDFVYALNVFYAGARSNAWGQGLWPHQYFLQQPIKVRDGITFKDYQITDMGNELTLGTFCHENGHMVCDFPDLYDLDNGSYGCGVFCLMCFGGTNAGALNPAQVNGYLKAAAGWGQIVSATAGTTMTLDAAVNGFARIDRSATEYFLIENRVRNGRDAVLPAQGLAVWHVDERGSNNNQQMQPNLHYECALIQADGRFDLEARRSTGDAGDLFGSAAGGRLDTTTPGYRWWDGSPVSLTIGAIGAPGAQTISFTIS